jgi:hypothetical protein
MCEGSDAFRADHSPTREQLAAGETEMSERFIATKKLSHLYISGPVSIDCF